MKLEEGRGSAMIVAARSSAGKSRHPTRDRRRCSRATHLLLTNSRLCQTLVCLPPSIFSKRSLSSPFSFFTRERGASRAFESCFWGFGGKSLQTPSHDTVHCAHAQLFDLRPFYATYIPQEETPNNTTININDVMMTCLLSMSGMVDVVGGGEDGDVSVRGGDGGGEEVGGGGDGDRRDSVEEEGGGVVVLTTQTTREEDKEEIVQSSEDQETDVGKDLDH